MHLYPKIKLFTEIFLFIIIGIFGAGYMRYTFLTFKNEQAVDILRITRSVEATFPKENFRTLGAKSGDLDKPEYLAVKKNLEAVVRVNTTARYAYIYTQNETENCFFMQVPNLPNQKITLHPDRNSQMRNRIINFHSKTGKSV